METATARLSTALDLDGSVDFVFVDLLALAALLVSLLAAGVAIYAADQARRQADAARTQADAAEEQVGIARQQVEAAVNQVSIAERQAQIAQEQADAAKRQVDEAKRSNDLAEAAREEDRKHISVRWEARMARDYSAIEVVNRGREIAYGVIVRRQGAEEDWIDVQTSTGEASETEVPPNEPYRLHHDQNEVAPDRVWVYWEGAGRPAAVEVDASTGSRRGKVW